MIITKICKSCGEEFSFTSKKGRPQCHCSIKCRNRYIYSRIGYKNKCIICAKDFIGKTKKIKSCSPACFYKLLSTKLCNRYDQYIVMANKVKRNKRKAVNEIKNLSNKYVKLVLYKETGIKMKDINNSNIIDLKRQQLKLHREIRKCKGEIKNVADRI